MINQETIEQAYARYNAANYKPGSILETQAKDEFFENYGRMPDSKGNWNPEPKNTVTFTGPPQYMPYQYPNYLQPVQTVPDPRKFEPGSLCWAKELTSWKLSTLVQWVFKRGNRTAVVISHDTGIPTELLLSRLCFKAEAPKS